MRKRQVNANDLYLFAVNTGDFYKHHVANAPCSLEFWNAWVRNTVVPRFCREVEPVTAMADVILTTAIELRDYYREHAKEL